MKHNITHTTLNITTSGKHLKANTQQSKRLVIICHGWDSNKNSETCKQLSKHTLKQQTDVYLFDWFSHGKTTGKRTEITISKAKQQLLEIIDYWHKAGYIEFAIQGSSFGGGIALLVADNVLIKNLVLFCPATTFTEKRIYELLPTPEAAQTFWTDAQQQKPPKPTNPITILHGEADEIIPISNSIQLSKKYPNIQLYALPGVGHRISQHPSINPWWTPLATFLAEA